MAELLQLTEAGLYCAAGDFYLDPWLPVERAVLTHAHSDHCRAGSASYLVSREGQHVFRTRLGNPPNLNLLDFGESLDVGGVRVSLHPAGHILGSAQVRLEHRGEVAVVSGDYKLGPDRTCTPFEPVRCHHFVTESTFGLPIYQWESQERIYDQINTWWRKNREEGKVSLLFGYALGKAQRLLAGLEPEIGPIYLHGAVHRLTEDYRASGVPLPPTQPASTIAKGTRMAGALLIAPPSAHGSAWARKFGAASTAFASGWMTIRGTRRRKAVDRGFVFSDHADWPGLLEAIHATGAERIWVTHGYVSNLVRHLESLGLNAKPINTRFEGERPDEERIPASAEESATEEEERRE
jgi:putative mRNA 3-end processing factor